MNKYFIQLFLQENTVILPGFGALTALNGNVEEIMFMPYLKVDDGKLADFIVETEGIDRQDAQNTIAKFIREMEANLSKGESFDIFQFGSFFKNESGDIEFKSWMKDQPTEEKEAAPIVSIPIEENTEIASVESEKLPFDEVKDEPIAFDTDAIIESPEVISEVIAETVIEKSDEPIIFADKKEEGDVRIAPAPIHEEEKKKRKAPVWLFPVLLIGLVSAGIYLFWDRTPEKQAEKIAKEESTPNEPIQDSQNTIKQDTTPVSEVEPEKPEIAEVPKPEKSFTNTEVEMLPVDAKGYFLIGGLYSSMEIAEGKVKKAKSEGMNAKILPQSKSKFYVSLDDFTDSKSANEMIKTLRDKGIKVWVLKK